MASGLWRAAALTVAAGLVTACTSSSSSRGEPTRVDEVPPATTSPTTPSESTNSTTPRLTDPAGDYAQPLVIALNIHRPTLDLTEALAKRVISGDITSWDQLGETGGALTVRHGQGALQRVVSNRDVVAVIPATKARPKFQLATVDGVDPLRSPRRYPVKTSATQPLPDVTTITVVGDIMLGRAVGAATPEHPGSALEPLSRRLARADLTLGNLESTLSQAGEPQQPGDDSFAADPAVVPALGRAGFDLVSLANNHTGDYGPVALDETLERLDRGRLGRVGAGTNAKEAWAPTILRRNGVSFGFLAFNAIGETPRATRHRSGAAEIRMQPRTGPLNASDLRRMSRDIHQLAKRVDVVVVIPHWGDQYTHSPVPDQRRVGRALVDAGADLVVGGHPHWVQGVQSRHGNLIVHSLGNFVFDMDTEQTREGIMLDLVFWDSTLLAAHLVPYVIGPDFAPRIVHGGRAQGILDDVWSASSGTFAN